MALEVYSAARPAVPLRAWLSSILLLLIASGLAGWMSWKRSGESLSARIEPPGWDISFQPPKRFEPLTPVLIFPANTIAYRTASARGDPVELVFHRIEAGPDADEICSRILRPHASLLLAVFSAPPARTAEKLGALDAVQILYPGIPMVVRAVRLSNGLGYAVSLRLGGGAIDEPLYRSFDLACRCIEIGPGS